MRILLFALVLLVACSEQSHPANNPPDTPRIAPLSPALALILTDLGLESRIVARHAWDQFLPKSIPSAGDQSGIDYETLLAANPSHVLLEWGQRDLPPRLTGLAADQSWHLSNHTLLTLEDITKTTRTLADTFGVTTDLPETLERAWQQQPPQNAGSVLMLIQTSPELAALGPGSAHHQILTRLGHQPALTEGAPYQTLIAEDLAKLNPAHIVLITPGNQSPDLGPIPRLNLDAQIHTLHARADLTPSPRLLSFTNRLNQALKK